ncbi:hypothetical protein FKP32DRAFT_1467214 [Trametes sanguinea]|nr:hypothetical protein FKP32DRAFT_1467214 [Trametes sanguinea]
MYASRRRFGARRVAPSRRRVRVLDIHVEHLYDGFCIWGPCIAHNTWPCQEEELLLLLQISRHSGLPRGRDFLYQSCILWGDKYRSSSGTRASGSWTAMVRMRQNDHDHATCYPADATDGALDMILGRRYLADQQECCVASLGGRCGYAGTLTTALTSRSSLRQIRRMKHHTFEGECELREDTLFEYTSFGAYLELSPFFELVRSHSPRNPMANTRAVLAARYPSVLIVASLHPLRSSQPVWFP